MQYIHTLMRAWLDRLLPEQDLYLQSTQFRNLPLSWILGLEEQEQQAQALQHR